MKVVVETVFCIKVYLQQTSAYEFRDFHFRNPPASISRRHLLTGFIIEKKITEESSNDAQFTKIACGYSDLFRKIK